MNRLPMTMPKGARIAEYLRRAACARELVDGNTNAEERRLFVIAAHERIAAARATRITNGIYWERNPS
jgi:hypothetical protein